MPESQEEVIEQPKYDQVLMTTKIDGKGNVTGIKVLEILRKGIVISEAEVKSMNYVVPQKDRGLHKFFIDSSKKVEEKEYSATEVGVFPNSFLEIKF